MASKQHSKISKITDLIIATVMNISLKGKSVLEWPRRFQEGKVPRFHDNGTGRW